MTGALLHLALAGLIVIVAGGIFAFGLFLHQRISRYMERVNRDAQDRSQMRRYERARHVGGRY